MATYSRKVYNLQLSRGDTKTYVLTFKDDGGNVIDITGWTVYFTVKKDLDDTDANAIIFKDITSHSDPTQGKTQVTISSTESDITPGNYYYDWQLKKPSGIICTFLRGLYIIKTDITLRNS